MTEIKKWFNLTVPYHFEWNDIFSALNWINFLLVVRFGLVASWFGCAVALVCIIDDIIEVKRLNLTFLHGSILALNVHFLLMLYFPK